MKLSIFCIVYNHEKYLHKAIEGFLIQRTNFDFEIVIGEDCSTDNSRAILLGYQEKYPSRFKLLLHDQNIGMAENVISTLEACKGEYVALCEGDDYWTDPNKLQKQVDFLDQNPDFSICYHRVMTLDETIGFLMPETLNRRKTEFEFDIEFLATGNKMNTQSVVFRNRNLHLRSNERFKQAPASDFYLHMLNAQFGRIKYFPEFMAVYRVNSENSAWSSLGKFNRKLKLIVLFNLLKDEFSPNLKVFNILNHSQMLEFKELLILIDNENIGKITPITKQLFNEKLFTELWIDDYLQNQIFQNTNKKKSISHKFSLLKKRIAKSLKPIVLKLSKFYFNND